MGRTQITNLFIATSLMFSCLTSIHAAYVEFDDGHIEWLENDLSEDIAEINDADPAQQASVSTFQCLPDVAQYKLGDWSQVVGIKRGISVAEAKVIASQHPEISYFFWVKGISLVLETSDGNYRSFHHGDTVFFTGNPWWGSAPELADGYIKMEGQ